MDKLKVCLPTFLAVVTTFMVIGILCAYAFVSIPPERVTAMNNVVVMVLTQWVAVMGYFFGSSQGSSKKTDAIINNMTENKE
jgi:hypothetical protein